MKTKYKSIFISDLHLGCRGCKTKQLQKFLKNNQSENLFLVGDIIDGWRLRRKFYWPQSHNNIVRQILTAAKRGTKVYYVIGNHDEMLRRWLSFFPKFGNVEIVDSVGYQAINGQNLLVVHGDMFDTLMQTRTGRVAMYLGDKIYDLLIVLNHWLANIREFFGLEYWSLSKAIKKNTKQVVGHIGGFETLLVDYCKGKGYNGIVCGHIHTPAIKTIDGLTYYNCGDWLENCSAIVETYEGEFILKYF